MSPAVPERNDTNDNTGVSVVAWALGTLLCFAVATCRGGRHNVLSVLALISVGGKYAD